MTVFIQNVSRKHDYFWWIFIKLTWKVISTLKTACCKIKISTLCIFLYLKKCFSFTFLSYKLWKPIATVDEGSFLYKIPFHVKILALRRSVSNSMSVMLLFYFCWWVRVVFLSTKKLAIDSPKALPVCCRCHKNSWKKMKIWPQKSKKLSQTHAYFFLLSLMLPNIYI